MTLQDKLVELRNEKGLSQREVADKLGVHVNSYSRVERGTKPSAAMLKKLSDFYGVDLSAFAVAPRAGEAGKHGKAAKSAIAAKPGKADGNDKAAESDKTAESDKAVTDAENAESENADEPMYINVELQYAGKAIPLSDIIEKAKEVSGNSAGKLDIYIKHEENKVYYVSGNSTGNFGI